ncbi:type II toxin-antitoxin system VapC family toxin [Romeria aff. gracilis LEGE 07310]|uniref:Ribonuclease VapC n=1 Tax=Vasconcelosia minhoensis LEGE 07310 TaxID=915328 RepID=A0A8J7AHJ3_9CYAN|nr:type II toxin-antitoxin system VapC family toxin [Romeria gracilis]MBE9079241.1 type II toxin-antitoxin system VapC family toxin [Romeria aff. gracilis LEGE 07310]
MKGWLLDTNIISELRKPNCHPAVKQWADSQQPQSFYLSTVTLAEIRFELEQIKNDDAFQKELNEWLNSTLRPWFTERILPVDEDVILVWRQLVEVGRKQGYTFGQPDLFIAAIARLHDLCVVTRNVTDFESAGIPIFNPFVVEPQR